MPQPKEEDIKNADPSEEYNDDGTKNPDYVAPGTDSKGTGASTENKGTEGGTDDTTKEDLEDFNDTIDPNKGVEIPTRISTLQNIISRKNSTIDKLKSKNKEEEDDINDDTSTLDDGTIAEIDKKVKSTLSPILDVFANDAEEKEFNSFISNTPDAKKYENHIKAYMKHDAYKNVPPEVIYHHLAFQAAQSLGAKRKAAADLEAKHLKGAGRGVSQTDSNIGNFPSPEEIDNMSEEEFEKMQQDALMGKFVKN